MLNVELMNEFSFKMIEKIIFLDLKFKIYFLP